MKEIIDKLEKMEKEKKKKYHSRQDSIQSLDKQVNEHVEILFNFYSEIKDSFNQLPIIVGRLHTLEDLHKSAIDLTNRVAALEKTVNNKLRVKEEDLKLLNTVQTSLNTNLTTISNNITNLEKRIEKIKSK